MSVKRTYSTSNPMIGTVNSFLTRAVSKRDKFNSMLRSNVPTDQIDEMVAKIGLKTVPINNISSPMKNPFQLAGLTRLTKIQQLMRKFCDKDVQMFEKVGSIAIQAACGSGKTLTGLYLIRHFQCKTLIISTRCAVIDQWYTVIRNLYPELKVWTNDRHSGRFKIEDADIWIFTPQFFNYRHKPKSDSTSDDSDMIEDLVDEVVDGKKAEVTQKVTDVDFNIQPSLIIYDEIHTMLSADSKNNETEFVNVLKYPFLRCLNGDWNELPYMLGISATYPEKLKYIVKVFGNVKYEKCENITNIPISVYDLRDLYTERERGKCDSRYISLNQYDAVEYYLKSLTFTKQGKKFPIDSEMFSELAYAPSFKGIKLPDIEISKKLKGLILTNNIDPSVWACLFVHKLLQCNVLLIRTNDVPSFYFPADQFQDYEFDKTVTFDQIKKDAVGIKCKKDYADYLKEAEIVVSTSQRMKEGFSCENLVWGIVGLFPYSELTRVQIAGRIRRSSNDVDIQKANRLLFVNSGKVPSDLFQGGKYNKFGGKPIYNWEFEEKLFLEDNIHYKTKHTF